MLTTVRITKAQAVLLQTMKITDETMSVKEYVAGGGGERAAGLPRRDV